MDELENIEVELAALMPIALEDRLLDRLEMVMEAEVQQMALGRSESIDDPGLDSLEEGLRGLEPHGMPRDMISRLDEAMSRWHENVPLEEKVVPIGFDEKQTKPWSNLRAVAAVALMGAASAFFMTGQNNAAGGKQLGMGSVLPVRTVSSPVPQSSNASPVRLVSGSAQSSLISEDDRGVLILPNQRAVRVKVVNTVEAVEYVSQDGKRITVREPRRKLRISPMKVD